MFRSRIRWMVVPITVLLTFGCARLSYGQNTLDKRLEAIEVQAKQGVNMDKLEAEALKLIQDFQSPNDKGKIYSLITSLYASQGAMKQPKKVITYATMALEYPLNTHNGGWMYLDWGLAIIVIYQSVDPLEYLKHRREIAVPLLTGLKLLLDNGVPEERVDLPGVGAYDIPPNDPKYQEIVAEHERQMNARKSAETVNELVQLRGVLTSNIFGIYALGADATVELQQLSDQILKNNTAVAALLARVKAYREKRMP